MDKFPNNTLCCETSYMVNISIPIGLKFLLFKTELLMFELPNIAVPIPNPGAPREVGTGSAQLDF